MSQLTEIQAAQKSLEDTFIQRMNELEAQIQSSGPAKDTVANIAEEFRTFRELIFNMLSILRKQIQECSKMYDTMETRHRRKALVFSGIAESDKEVCPAVVVDVLVNKMSFKDFAPTSIKSCFRLGAATKNHPRPILVRFCKIETKRAVWKAKSTLKGSSISVKEFLTKPRQLTFGRARQHFGIRAVWTNEGVIVVKTPDGKRSKITSMEELKLLLKRFPKGIENAAAVGAENAGSGNVNTKTAARKN